MKTYTFYIFFVVISLLSSSCSDLLFWEDADEQISTTIEISNISKIQVESIFHIEFIQDTEEYIIATGTQDQLNKLKLSSKENTSFLKHSYNNLMRNDTPVKLEIHIRTISHIHINSPANITNTKLITTDKLNIHIAEDSELVEMNMNLNCQSLSFHVKASVNGEYQFKGECPNANYVLNGTTNIRASNFKTQNISIAQNSIGEAHIFAEKKITANIYSFGNIYYKGNPEIIINRIQINNQSPTAKLIPISTLN